MAQTGQIGVDGMKVGTLVEADYYNPTGSGRIIFNLSQDSNNIVLHFNPRFDEKVLVLDTKTGGNYGKEEKPDGYDFTHGIRMRVKIYADTENFKIFINDKFFYQYKYRGMTSAQVKTVEFVWQGDDAVAAQLVSLRTGYMSSQ